MLHQDLKKEMKDLRLVNIQEKPQNLIEVII